MAEWTNLFDLGGCIVRVRHTPTDGASSIIFEQQMARGDTASFDWPGREQLLTVFANGVVTLSSNNDVGIGDPDPGEVFALEVEPVDAIESEGSRALTVNLFPTSNRATAYVNADGDFVDLDIVSTIPDLNEVSPDPVVLTDLSGAQQMIGVSARQVLA